MKVLIPVDGSKYSSEGLKVAADFAKSKGAEIVIIHVAPFIAGMDLELSAARREEIMESAKRNGEQVLSKAAGLLKDSGVNSKTLLATAPSVAEELIKTAESEKADLIIIGSRGLTGAARFMLGSTASKVVRHCPCSVYVVKTAE